MPIRTFLVALLASLALACSSAETSEPPRSRAAPPPPSALVALVRALEVVDGLKEPDTWVKIRALECDTLIDRRAGQEYVRVVLDLTVLARDVERAYGAFGALAAALEAEARSAERVPDVDAARVRRTFGELDWMPELHTDGPTFAQLVSVSDSVRVEIRSGRPRVLEPGEEDSSGTLAPEEYVHRIAAEPELALEPLELARSLTHPWPGATDLRLRIAPADREACFERLRIGSFLQRLEAESPFVRVTHLVIHPADTGPELWSFEAALDLRRGSS